MTVKTDEAGNFALRELKPGQYNILVTRQGVIAATRNYVLQPGQILEPVMLRVTIPGTISGTVRDENGDPVPGISVSMLSKVYALGEPGYQSSVGPVRTDEKGHYCLENAPPGSEWLIVAYSVSDAPETDAPADPALRKPVFLPTAYPSSALDGGEPVDLRDGQDKQGIDIKMRTSPSYCIAGAVRAPEGSAAPALYLEEPPLTDGPLKTPPKAKVDGSFRICGLHPGAYRIAIAERGSGEAGLFAQRSFTLSDRDLPDIVLQGRPGVPLRGRVEWAGDPPRDPVSATIFLRARWNRPGLGTVLDVDRSPVPRALKKTAVLFGEYQAGAAGGLPRGVYVSEILYGGISIPNRWLTAGEGSDLVVRLSADGGFLNASVTHASGKPAAGVFVAIFSATAGTQSEMAATLVSGGTNSSGIYSSGTLKPGKYLVLASEARFGSGVDSIKRLWSARTKAEAVEIAPKATAQVALRLVKAE